MSARSNIAPLAAKRFHHLVIHSLLAGRFRARTFVVYFGDLLPRDRFFIKALHLDREEIDMGIEVPLRKTIVVPVGPIPEYHPEPAEEPARQPSTEPAPAKEPAPEPAPAPAKEPAPADPEKVPA